MPMKSAIIRQFTDAARVAEDFQRANQEMLIEVVNRLVNAFRNGRKLLIFGNGGSAADAQHIAAELVNRFRVDRPALAAIALTTDTSILTAVANDSSYDRVFARQVEALGRVDDIVLALSTSGSSPSILEGVAAARRLGLTTVGLTGSGGKALAKACDFCLTVPSEDTPRIQECHILALHVVCDLVERELAR